MNNSGMYLDSRGAKEFLNCGPTTLWQLTKEGKITPRKVGGKNLYARAELIEMVESSIAEPSTEPLKKKKS